ncbi:MAG: hypothetical protein A2Z14_17475 [Chloroflexi bacterium RBG_16_48_8]|nr:MAG: hypothetical protein A2Z14_17475 [Chloroflexi bacterium RBG_16_48_8]
MAIPSEEPRNKLRGILSDVFYPPDVFLSAGCCTSTEKSRNGACCPQTPSCIHPGLGYALEASVSLRRGILAFVHEKSTI